METTPTQKEANKELRFLPDRPTNTDRIGIHQKIANNLKQTVMNDLPKPFVIGLFGSWGSGKSTIVEILKASKDLRFKIVVVDAWRKDKGNFLRQFIKKLARELLSENEAEQVVRRVDFKHSVQDSAWKPDRGANVAFGLYLIMAVIILFGAVTSNLWTPMLPAKDMATIAMGIITAIAFTWLVPRYSKKVDTRSEEITIDDPGWFREIYFNKILAKANGISVCIVIDNLDRVPTEDALAIIKYIKTFIVDIDFKEIVPNKAKVTFLIPCDDDALINRIRNDSSIGEPTEFLRKFINVTIRIPQILEQDNTGYIRDLISETGIVAESNSLENMAFILSRVSNNNPRKPKTILNHFVARYNLAAQFAECSKIAQQHPDWFFLYSVIEFEFPKYQIHDYLEHSKRVGEGASLLNEPFKNSVRPILDEIPISDWRTFQFLKKPNHHDLIPGFHQMVEFALERNAEKFNAIFLKLLPHHQQLVNLVWDERKDHPSRMAFAERILWFNESIEKLVIPKRVLMEIASMIQMHVTGWTRLPPKLTYELVIKPSEQCLRSVITGFNSSAFDGKPESKLFFYEIMSSVLRDFDEVSPYSEYRGDIERLLSANAKQDEELAILALKYPKYKNEAVFTTALNVMLNSDTKAHPEWLVRYLLEVSKSDKTQFEAFAALLRTAAFNAFQKFLEKSEKQKLALVGLVSEFVLRLERKDFAQQVSSATDEAKVNLFGHLNNCYETCKRVNLWEAAFMIHSLWMDLVKLGGNNTHLKQVANDNARNMSQAFLVAAPERLAEKLLRDNANFFRDFNFSQIRGVANRSTRFAKRVILQFPNLRSDTVSFLVSSHPEWLKDIVSAFKRDKKILGELGKLMLMYAGATPSNALYESIGELDGSALGLKQSIEEHFEKRIRNPETKNINQLTDILKAMESAKYNPTASQISSLEKIRDLIPVDQFDPAKKNVFQRFFGKPKTKN